MKYDEAKMELIQAWGNLGSAWGISKTMAQIHALLMISPESLTTDDIIAELQISRGNVSMSLKALIEWGIVEKQYTPGDRKEYFKSLKDITELAAQVAKERQRRELGPVIKTLTKVQNVEDPNAQAAKVTEMNRITKDLLGFAKQADSVLDLFVKTEKNWFFNKLLKLFK